MRDLLSSFYSPDQSSSASSLPPNTASRFIALDTINTASFDTDHYMNLLLLDAGLRIACRFHSHCPQTTCMYYHPPARHKDSSHQRHQYDGTAAAASSRDSAAVMGRFGSKGGA
ncbi:hypothetical protein C2S52_001374 [Perilla frutescens var. hirtella]|nr:hypothetical protein C2S52_001374 [Perilla frutescens var. hirtella]